MKKKILFAVLAVAIMVGTFSAGKAFGAQNAEPGTQGDPLVTLSYLESRLDELKGSVAAATSSSGGASASSGFIRLRLEKGQSIILADGGEIVVYSGNGTVLGTTGMLSLSTSEKFEKDMSVVLYNHYLALGGTSGVRTTGSMIVYVRGEYTLNQGD